MGKKILGRVKYSNFLNFVSILIFLILGQEECFASKDLNVNEAADFPARVFLATGLTYLNFQQTFHLGANRELQFKSLDFPYLDVLLEIDITAKSYIRVNFLKYTPSSTDSNGQTSVGQKTIGLGSLGVEYGYVPFSTSQSMYLNATNFFIGFQMVALPILMRTGVSSVDAKAFRANFLRFGLSNEIALGQDWSMSPLLSFLFPISSNSGEITSPQFLEVELKFSKKINESLLLGFAWNVKRQSYQVSSSELDPVTNQSFRATQENIYSILSAHLGYSW